MKVRDGQLTIQDRYRFDAALKAFPNGNAILRLERPRKIRSLQQSRYWWGVCIHLVSEHTGYEPEEVHELAKQMFIPKAVAIADRNGEVVGEYVVGGSTTKLTTAEMTEFIERFRRWAAETLNVYIPDPEPVS